MNNNGEKPTPEQALALLEEHVKSDEIEHKLEGMTDAELAKEGVTDEKLAAIAEADRALAARLGYEAPKEEASRLRSDGKDPSNVRDIRSAKRWQRWKYAFTGSGAIAATTTLLLALSRAELLPAAFYPPVPTTRATAAAPGTPLPVPGGVPTLTEAQYDRLYAYERCLAGDHVECTRWLDEAKKLDPAGDSEGTVITARLMAKGLAARQQRDH